VDEVGIYAHYLVQYRDQKGHQKGRTFNFLYDAQSGKVKSLKRFPTLNRPNTSTDNYSETSKARDRIEAALQNALIEWLPDRQSRAGLQVSLVGVFMN
jgi:hypothetical protein